MALRLCCPEDRPKFNRVVRTVPRILNCNNCFFITTKLEFGKWGTIFDDDKLAVAIIDRLVHHGRLVEFNGGSCRMSSALMLGGKKPKN